MEGRWHLVRRMTHRTLRLSTDKRNSYNRYLAIAARVVRRSLKEDKRLAAERRGEMDLRFAKWQVSRHGKNMGTGRIGANKMEYRTASRAR